MKKPQKNRQRSPVSMETGSRPQSPQSPHSDASGDDVEIRSVSTRSPSPIPSPTMENSPQARLDDQIRVNQEQLEVLMDLTKQIKLLNQRLDQVMAENAELRRRLEGPNGTTPPTTTQEPQRGPQPRPEPMTDESDSGFIAIKKRKRAVKAPATPQEPPAPTEPSVEPPATSQPPQNTLQPPAKKSSRRGGRRGKATVIGLLDPITQTIIRPPPSENTAPCKFNINTKPNFNFSGNPTSGHSTAAPTAGPSGHSPAAPTAGPSHTQVASGPHSGGPAASQPQSSSPQNSGEKIPPIVLRNKQHYLEILRACDSNAIEVKHTVNRKDGVNFYVKTTTCFRNLTTLLTQRGYPFHSYSLPEDRSLRTIVRGIPENVPVAEVETALLKSGFHPKRVQRWTSKTNGTLAIVQVVVPREEKRILELKKLDSAIVSVEIQKSNGQPVQCYKCQLFGHTSRHCGAQSRCVKCGENHDTRLCKKQKGTPATCCNCRESHTANFTGCVCRPAPRKIQKKTKPANPPAVSAWDNQGGRRLANQLAGISQNPAQALQPTLFPALSVPQLFNPSPSSTMSPEMSQVIRQLQSVSTWASQVAHMMMAPFSASPPTSN